MKSFFYLIGLTSLVLFTFISCGGSDRSSASKETYYSFNDSDTIYEDGEDGSISRWELRIGHPIQNVNIGANGSDRSILVRENWLRGEDGNLTLNEYGDATNNAHYELPLNNDYQFILEFDKMKKIANITHCFTVGVKLDTIWGERHISFNTFFDQQGSPAMEQWILDDTVLEMVFPLDMAYVNEANVWRHLRFNILEYLHEFEPDNEIINMKSFYFQGGDDYLDNIRLVSE